MSGQLRLFDFDEAELLEALQVQSQEDDALTAATVGAQRAKDRLKTCTTSYEAACKRVSRLQREAAMKTAKIQGLEQVEAEVVEEAAPDVIDADCRQIVLMTRDNGGLRMPEGEPEEIEDVRTAAEWEATGRFSSEGEESTALVATGND